MKKLLSLLLSCICCFTFFSCKEENPRKFVDNGIMYERITFEHSENETPKEELRVIGCESDVTILTVPASINDLTVSGIGRDAFCNNTQLKEITLPDTIDHISLCEAPFKGCNNVEKITVAFSDITLLFTEYGNSDNESIPSSLHYVYLTKACKKISPRDFYKCTYIREVHIPNSVEIIEDGSDLTTIGANGIQAEDKYWFPFFGCSNLSIYCESYSKPSGWGEYWNNISSTAKATVYWNQY